MEIFAEAGLTPMEVLKAATWNGAVRAPGGRTSSARWSPGSWLTSWCSIRTRWKASRTSVGSIGWSRGVSSMTARPSCSSPSARSTERSCQAPGPHQPQHSNLLPRGAGEAVGGTISSSPPTDTRRKDSRARTCPVSEGKSVTASALFSQTRRVIIPLPGEAVCGRQGQKAQRDSRRENEVTSSTSRRINLLRSDRPKPPRTD